MKSKAAQKNDAPSLGLEVELPGHSPRNPISITDLTSTIRELLETGIGEVWVAEQTVLPDPKPAPPEPLQLAPPTQKAAVDAQSPYVWLASVVLALALTLAIAFGGIVLYLRRQKPQDL